jgi:hypothetical protein
LRAAGDHVPSHSFPSSAKFEQSTSALPSNLSPSTKSSKLELKTNDDSLSFQVTLLFKRLADQVLDRKVKRRLPEESVPSFAFANRIPEIFPWEAEATVVATGWPDFPNPLDTS